MHQFFWIEGHAHFSFPKERTIFQSWTYGKEGPITMHNLICDIFTKKSVIKT